MVMLFLNSALLVNFVHLWVGCFQIIILKAQINNWLISLQFNLIQALSCWVWWHAVTLVRVSYFVLSCSFYCVQFCPVSLLFVTNFLLLINTIMNTYNKIIFYLHTSCVKYHTSGSHVFRSSILVILFSPKGYKVSLNERQKQSGLLK